MKHYLWSEKYRPTRIEDIILPKHLKKIFLEIVDSGEIQNCILSGTAGLGKTTVAKALCHTLGVEYLMINASEEGGIDTLRTKIKNFASSISLHGGYKVVILDEADHLNPQSTQPALRGFIQEFSSNCRFIMTCNYIHKIIEPLHSRCPVIDFNVSAVQLSELACSFMTDCLIPILEKENIQYSKKVLSELIIKYAPDWRRILGECQKFSHKGKIDSDILVSISNESLNELVGYLKNRDFKSMRSWVVNNSALDGVTTFRALYDSMYQVMQPKSIPQAVLVLAEYGYKSSFMADKELNVVACLTELMVEVEWK